MRLRGGVYLAAFSKRFTNTCSKSTGSTETSGNVGLDVDVTLRVAESRFQPGQRRTDHFVEGTQSFLSAMPPDSRRVMSSRLATSRSRRSAFFADRLDELALRLAVEAAIDRAVRWPLR